MSQIKDENVTNLLFVTNFRAESGVTERHDSGVGWRERDLPGKELKKLAVPVDASGVAFPWANSAEDLPHQHLKIELGVSTPHYLVRVFRKTEVFILLKVHHRMPLQLELRSTKVLLSMFH